MTVGADISSAAASPDLWRRGWLAVQRWVLAHSALVGGLRRVRVVLSWLGLLVIVAVLITQPEIREGAGVYLDVYYLLIAWFFLARSKTLSWRFVSLWFTGGLLWSLAIAKITSVLAVQVTQMRAGSLRIGANVRADGPSIAIAGVGEECLKLLPLVVCLWWRPGDYPGSR